MEVIEWKETNWRKNYAAKIDLRDWSFVLISERLWRIRVNNNRYPEREKRSKFENIAVCNDKKCLVKRFQLCI